MNHPTPFHAVLWTLVFLGACRTQPTVESKPDPETPNITAKSSGPVTAKLPSEPGEFSPSLASLDGAYDPKVHLETEKCVECHQPIVDEWKESVHALASMNNPYYRASFEDFAEAAGRDKTPFCGGCHDPTLTFDHSVKQPIVPDDIRAHAGVTCVSCHGVSTATQDGNASYALDTSPIPYPVDGDDASLQAHIKRLAPDVVRTENLCVSCHKGFLSPATGHGAVIAGLNEFAPWRASGYNGNPTTRIDAVEKKSCTSCHMPETDGHKSHRFPGGHSTLAAAINSEKQLQAITDLLRQAATIDVAAIGVGEISAGSVSTLKENDNAWIDVTVWNKNTGHNFPGGALDLRDTWIELVVKDKNGKTVAEAGTQHEKTGEDELALRLKATVSSPEGEIVKGHKVNQFRTPIFNRSIKPRDVLVARYEWSVPKGVAQPVTIHAKLRHRRLAKGLYEAGCNLQNNDTGKLFQKATKQHYGVSMDACVTQPVIDIGESQLTVGGARLPEKEPWLLNYHRGLGLLHQLQEAIDESKEAFELALKSLPADAEKIDRARILFGLGKVAARQGRTQDAMDYFAKTEKLTGEHAAIHFARGQAHQQTFHNEEAVQWFEKAAAMVADDRIYRQLAIASGSIMKADAALNAAHKGLAIEPRDPHLLRSQMLALRKLEATDEVKEAAKAAFLAFKRDEASAAIRDKCTDASETCRRERLPIPVFKLRPAK